MLGEVPLVGVRVAPTMAKMEKKSSKKRSGYQKTTRRSIQNGYCSSCLLRRGSRRLSLLKRETLSLMKNLNKLSS